MPVTAHPRPLFAPPATRRHVLARSLVAAGVLGGWPLVGPVHSASPVRIANVTGLYSVPVARAERVRDTDHVAQLLRDWPGQVAVGGGRYSMGGQVAVAHGLHLDMRGINRLVWLRPEQQTARVQAGMRWRDLQTLLDPLDLAVMTMQSYANFTVGGSVSVNAHGRYVGHGPVGHSVLALQLVLANGTVVEASRTQHPDLFAAAVGGYGAVGVITEVELRLQRNVRMARVVQELALADYLPHLDNAVLADPRSVLHNADLLPPHFDRPVSITWKRSDEPLTEPQRLVPEGQAYTLEKNLLWAITELPAGERLRSAVIHPLLGERPAVKWLNHEASLDVAELEPRTRRLSTYVLQEYFVPRRTFLRFAQGMARILNAHEVEALNVSIRHSPQDEVSSLPWAREEVLSFVLYFKQRTHERAQRQVGEWTRALIDLALACEGRYYLPYQLHATRRQFESAYPEAAAFKAAKARWDPAGRFSNRLWAKYL